MKNTKNCVNHNQACSSKSTLQKFLMLKIHSVCAVILCILAMPFPTYAAEIDTRSGYWEEQAFICPAGDGTTFPSRPTGDPLQPCDDGDITLFNGLLCAAGDMRGCDGVAAAQDKNTGQWYRSPRIRISGNDRGGSAFSPDMALGVQLYLAKTGDIDRAQKWLTWLHEKVPCTFEIFGKCVLLGIPRFCTDDLVEKGCVMRPGDAAALSETVNFLQKKYGLADLPNGRLRKYLQSMAGKGPQLEKISSYVNKPGFSQHLIGVSILLYRSIGINDQKLDGAAERLVGKNSGNAFYSILAKRPKDQIIKEILYRCPNPNIALKYPLNEWQWERENSDLAWERSCFWDCIFAKGLLMTL